jgi:hypothetical protein
MTDWIDARLHPDGTQTAARGTEIASFFVF